MKEILLPLTALLGGATIGLVVPYPYDLFIVFLFVGILLGTMVPEKYKIGRQE